MGIKIFDPRDLSMASIVDEKLKNYYVDESTGNYIIGSILEYLLRVTFEHRFPGTSVLILLPKDGTTPSFSYATTELFDTGLADFDTKYYAFIGGLDDLNFVEISTPSMETGRLESLISRSVAVVFASPFAIAPIGRKNLHVYRVVEVEVGKLVDEQVLFFDLVVTPTGFTLAIDESESLTGIVIEYMFTKTN